MLVSELAERADVTVATVKFYIREGMLPRGDAVSATRAEYGQAHLARLRLIGALTQVRELPLARVRDILALLDAPIDDAVATMGRAVGALPPYVTTVGATPRATAAIDALGFAPDSRFAAIAQLDSAIAAVQAAGLPWDEEVLRRCAEPMIDLAEAEIRAMAELSEEDSILRAVLGTALYEPVILALRRLAHEHVLRREA